MQLKQYIDLKHKGVKGDYAKAIGVRADQVSRLLKGSCLVDHNGWPHPSFKKRNKVK